MGYIAKITSYIKKISLEFETWQIAIRIRDERCLYEGNRDGFITVPNSSRYWRADPFVYKYKGINYLFAEMFDRKTQKGVIGVAKLKNGKCGKFRVCLKLPYHLSYPCIFEQEGAIYMLPECNESQEISLYKTKKFPLKWEKERTLYEKAAVDTTPIFDDKGLVKAYFTSLYEPIMGGNDNLYILEKGKKEQVLFENNTNSRMAGNLIKEEKLIRPTQDDTLGYGDSLIFNEIDNLNPKEYKEHKMLRVLPPQTECKENEVSISLIENKKNAKYTGIHTYNQNEDYEVIDLKIESCANFYVFWRNRKKIYQKLIRRFRLK